MASTARSALEDFDTGPTGAKVEPALRVADSESWKTDEECDLLVIGCGLAGAAAALKAAENTDVQVSIIDRFDGGGASQLSGGVLYCGGGTVVQTEAGLTDTVAAMVNYLHYETGDIISHQALEKFCAESASYITWLQQRGAKFGGPLTEAKTSYPSEHYLYYSGNERLEKCKAIARPAPRGHRTKPWGGSEQSAGGKYGASGQDLMFPLKRAIEQTPNIHFRRCATARRLVLDTRDAVIGAEIWQIPEHSLAARIQRRLLGLSTNMMLTVLGVTRPMSRVITAIERRSARRILIRAKRGVVIACGGFGFNPRLLNEAAHAYRNIAPLGTIGDDGSGIMLGNSVGGVLDRMERVSAWRFLYPPESWVQGVLVGKSGERLLNEESYGSRIGEALFERSEGEGWVILDEPLTKTARTEAVHPTLLPFQRYALKAAMTRYANSAPTLKELAASIGISPTALTATVDRYNDDIRASRPDQFGKADSQRKAILKAPFTAVNISHYAKFNPILGITMGGLKVDEGTGAVLNDRGQPISGLYAAGRTAVGVASNFYVSGLSLSDCVWSGWRAADSIMSAQSWKSRSS
jgi:3-oxo-5alpha-steroid 4-dehydrogenase